MADLGSLQRPARYRHLSPEALASRLDVVPTIFEYVVARQNGGGRSLIIRPNTGYGYGGELRAPSKVWEAEHGLG